VIPCNEHFGWKRNPSCWDGQALSFFFLIKCKNIIDKKGAGVQQYKEKGTKSFDQIESKTSLLNIK
jgi:hypothetical protein